jgi:glycosyltransferase involved in cell wall biosynthesis
MTDVLHVQKVSGISGSEAHLLSLLPLLRAHGWDARMLVLHEGEPGATAFVERMRAAQVPTETRRMRLDLDPALFVHLARRRPTIVHTHLLHADLHGLPAAATARVPVRVSTKHGFNEFRSNHVLALADRSAGRLAHAQIAISHGLARYLAATEGFAPDAFTVVHYGIEQGPVPPPPPPEPRVLAIGRLIPIKGFDVLLRAFARARERLPALTLTIAGAGPLEGKLRQTAPEGVTWLGHVDGVAPLLEDHAFVAVPSRGEGFGMVALEAAERGRAAVVSNVGGLPEIVAHGETGVVVPPGDPDALADALLVLGSDPPRVRTLGEAARGRALAQFSPEAAADGVGAVYRRLLSARSTAHAASSTSRKSNGTR